MNAQAHRLIHNRHRAQPMAVPETARGHGRGRSRCARRRARGRTCHAAEHLSIDADSGGSLSVNAGEAANVYASQLSAGQDLKVSGKEVNVVGGIDTASGSYGTEKSGDGISQLFHRTGTGFGNEASTDSGVSMSTLAPASLSGQSVTLTATRRDITLGAASIEAQEGVTLNAEHGAVNLAVVKTGEQASHSTSGKDIMYQRSSDEGSLKETANYTRIETGTPAHFRSSHGYACQGKLATGCGTLKGLLPAADNLPELRRSWPRGALPRLRQWPRKKPPTCAANAAAPAPSGWAGAPPAARGTR